MRVVATTVRRGRCHACGASTACGPREPTLVDPAEPLPPFEDRVAPLETRHNAYAGLFAVDVDPGDRCRTGPTIRSRCVRRSRPMRASRVLQKAAAGELQLTDAVSIEPDDIVANSPVTRARVGQTMTIGELCQAALQRSDNAAGNWLLRIIGGPSRGHRFRAFDRRRRGLGWTAGRPHSTRRSLAIRATPARRARSVAAIASCSPATCSAAPSASSSRSGCAATRPRAAGGPAATLDERRQDRQR